MPPRLYSETIGPETTDPARRVVLVHGFTQSGRSWSAVAADLAGSGHEVVAVDAPAHGGSAGVGAGNLAEAARLVAESGGDAIYVGYSMGGRICLQLALDHPAVVRRLVLVSTTAGIEDEAGRAVRRHQDRELAGRLDPPGGGGLTLEAFLDEWLAGPLFADLPPAAADRAARLVNTPAGLADSLRTLGTGTMPPLWDRLAELAMPVLCIAGERDAKFVAAARRVSALVPGAALEVLAGAGHAAPFERPGEFAEVVRRFVDGG